MRRDGYRTRRQHVFSVTLWAWMTLAGQHEGTRGHCWAVKSQRRRVLGAAGILRKPASTSPGKTTLEGLRGSNHDAGVKSRMGYRWKNALDALIGLAFPVRLRQS
uniref:Secreted protein n=1 Tax=Psilocybe cubensis TaxID=181762 RepID=A0A8H8CGW9_PSICU